MYMGFLCTYRTMFLMQATRCAKRHVDSVSERLSVSNDMVAIMAV